MRTSDVVIIGAGVQGLSAAYNIALGGAKNVVVVESCSGPGHGSSGRSGSMLMKSRENAPKIALSLYSYDRFMRFNDEFGEPLVFRKTGFLSAVPHSEAARYEKEHALRRAMGVPSERLDPDAIRTLAPGLVTDDLAFGIFGPDDGEIRAEQILTAYERRARQLGADISYEERATGIVTGGGRVLAVQTTHRLIPCRWVVNAAGADASEVARWVSLTLPIENRQRSIYIVSSNCPDFHRGPMVEDAELEWYYRPLADNQVLIGMGYELGETQSDSANLAFIPTVRRATTTRAPGLADFEVIRGTSGIRPITPDILPIIGPVPGLDGLINSCGWGGEGIMHSPAGGSLVADIINETQTCGVDCSPFLLSRFDSTTKPKTHP